jgi:hypothetical protein
MNSNHPFPQIILFSLKAEKALVTLCSREIDFVGQKALIIFCLKRVNKKRKSRKIVVLLQNSYLKL